MLTREQLPAYLRRLHVAEADALIPVPMAAAALGVAPTTIRAYVRAGTLTEMQVASESNEWVGVSLFSLDAELRRREEKVTDLANLFRPILESLPTDTIEYGELMSAVGLSWRNPHHRSLTGIALGNLSEKSLEADGFLISVCAVQKATQRPNEAFFGLARDLGAMSTHGNQENFWQSQIKKFRAWKGRKK